MSREPLYASAQASLRDFIRGRGLSAGDRLPPESVLAAELGVSRLSLREATRSMQTLGIIEARPGTGLYVSSFSFRPLIEQLPYGLAPGSSFHEMLTVREAMETGLMPAVAELHDSAELDTCVRIAERMAEHEAAGSPIDGDDRDFHLQLYRALGNPLVDSLIELFWDVFTRLEDQIPGEKGEHRAEAHLGIAHALKSGAGLEASRRMRAHFDDVRWRVVLLADATRHEPDNAP